MDFFKSKYVLKREIGEKGSGKEKSALFGGMKIKGPATKEDKNKPPQT